MQPNKTPQGDSLAESIAAKHYFDGTPDYKTYVKSRAAKNQAQQAAASLPGAETDEKREQCLIHARYQRRQYHRVLKSGALLTVCATLILLADFQLGRLEWSATTMVLATSLGAHALLMPYSALMLWKGGKERIGPREYRAARWLSGYHLAVNSLMIMGAMMHAGWMLRVVTITVCLVMIMLLDILYEPLV